jgi:hypothetical protein
MITVSDTLPTICQHPSSARSALVPTRREALCACAGTVLAVVVGSTVAGAPAGAAVVRRRAPRPHPLSRSRFAPLVGSAFRLTGPSGSRTVRLVGAPAAATGAAAERRFTLQFSDRARTPLREGIYTVRHARIGAVELFLAPVGSRTGRYEAVVNRLA